MSTVNKCYTEKTFFATHTIYLAEHKRCMNTRLILKAVFRAESSWNWLVSLDTCLHHECSLKDIPTCMMQLQHENIQACSWLICTAWSIALGKQCQATKSHIAGTPCLDTHLAYSFNTAFFNLSSINCSKGGAESSPTELASRPSLLTTT